MVPSGPSIVSVPPSDNVASNDTIVMVSGEDTGSEVSDTIEQIKASASHISTQTEGDDILASMESCIQEGVGNNNDIHYKATRIMSVVTLLRQYPQFLSVGLDKIEKIAGEIQDKSVSTGYIFEKLARIEQKFRFINHKATHDNLTNLFNRYKIYEIIFHNLIALKPEEFIKMSYLYMDIDNFKRYNTDYGHHGGDKALKFLANVFGEVSLEYMIAPNRFGGEEFGALAKDSSILKDAGDVVNQRVAGVGVQPSPFTISGGISSLEWMDPMIIQQCSDVLISLQTHIDYLEVVSVSSLDEPTGPLNNIRDGQERRSLQLPDSVPIIHDRRSMPDRRASLSQKEYALELYDRIYGGIMNLVVERSDMILSYVKENGKNNIMTYDEIPDDLKAGIHASSQKLLFDLTQQLTRAHVFLHQAQYGPKYPLH